MEQYSQLYSVYDELNDSYDYDSLAKFLKNVIKENEKIDSSLVLDLACGTGKLTFKLRELGYDMTGVDLSSGMLSKAQEYAFSNGISDVLFLCQDMTEFELYGTVDACVCTLDSINYLTKIGDVKKCFSLVHNYLIPDGIFVFDINTPYRFKEVYGNNDFVLENENSLCAWQNEYKEKSGLCRFDITLFEEQADRCYLRSDASLSEKAYTEKALRDMLAT